VLASARPFRAWITNQGETVKVRTLQIAVGNGRHYGGGNVVERSARIDDGTLDLYSLEVENVWKLALMLRAFRTGEHGAWQEVRTRRCVEFDVTTRRPRSVNVDGDLLTQTPAHFRIEPKAVRVFVP
jgi:diacylglycerol kinase family enzyme